MKILTKAYDDPQFVELVSRTISGLASEKCPEKVFVVRIENWFDQKWLNFSGVGRVGFFEDWRLEVDTALEEFRQDQTTLPPFSPKRVIEEYCFLRDKDGDYQPSIRTAAFIKGS